MTEESIKTNADKLISMGKEAWLKKRKKAHKKIMTDEQQESEIIKLEREREQAGMDEQE